MHSARLCTKTEEDGRIAGTCDFKMCYRETLHSQCEQHTKEKDYP